jgi:methylphosphotriester-DNA--protein-cysteine methyltransferase
MGHRVREVIALAEESLNKGWSPAKLAALVNLSPSRLHQLFKEETGMSPARYPRQLSGRRARPAGATCSRCSAPWRTCSTRAGRSQTSSACSTRFWPCSEAGRKFRGGRRWQPPSPSNV